MKFYSIIIALLLASVVSTAQTSSSNTGQTIAMLERTASDSYETRDNVQDAEKLSITTDKRINAVKVMDEAGDVVISRSARDGESVKFSLRNLQKGLYYLHIYCDGENIVRKFLKK
jgi:hypothetical protein